MLSIAHMEICIAAEMLAAAAGIWPDAVSPFPSMGSSSLASGASVSAAVGISLCLTLTGSVAVPALFAALVPELRIPAGSLSLSEAAMEVAAAWIVEGTC